ncbi:MAG: extracellular solute-binding protein [Deltaproteobacteria bacterium]|nr:extracellular solute-binding protein [Deltaproteobacteria bacterium]
MKKLALFLVLILLLASVAGCTTGKTTKPAETTGGSASGEGGLLFAEPVTLTMTIVENASYPYDKESFIRKKVLELFNVDLDITSVQDGYYDKINLDIASGDLDDIIYNTNYNELIKAGNDGAYVDYNEHMDKMPNFNAWVNDRKDLVSYFLSAEGKLFISPNEGYGDVGNRTFWLYRKDVFEKHDLKPPTTDEEVYEVAKKLKELYPNAYPVSNRGTYWERIGVQWNTGYPMYYSDLTGKWSFGPTEDNFKDMLIFFNKLYEEELIPPNILTIDTKGWQDIISTDKGFMTSDYIARIDFFNSPMREQNPDFTLAFMPPFKGGANGTPKHSIQETLVFAGLSVSSSSKMKEEAIKYVDNMYTDASEELYSWGVEGESFEKVDGKKQYIDVPEGAGYQFVIAKYGFFQRGFFARVDPEAMGSPYSVDTLAAYQEAPKHDHVLRAPFVPFKEDAMETKNILEPNILTHMEEAVANFLIGQKDFSEWDTYKKELDNLGLQDLIELYNSSYDEFMSTQE